jgi:hypothetical protein
MEMEIAHTPWASNGKDQRDSEIILMCGSPLAGGGAPVG